MTNHKTIFVTGATGNQGGAVARQLAAIGFKVKALVRNPDSPKAKSLISADIQLIKGDLNNGATYREHLKAVDGVFSVQTFEHGIDREINQGIALASMAKESGVYHFVYSSVIGADLNTGIPHFDSKFKIEDHIRQIGLPFTILRPASLFENFLIPQVKSRLLKGKLVQPINRNTVNLYIASEDIGKATVQIFKNPDQYRGKTIPLAAELLTTQQVADLFASVTNKTMEYQKLPSIITRLAMGKDLYTMFKWLNEKSAFSKKELELTLKEFDHLLSLKTWIERNFKTDNPN